MGGDRRNKEERGSETGGERVKEIGGTEGK